MVAPLKREQGDFGFVLCVPIRGNIERSTMRRLLAHDKPDACSGTTLLEAYIEALGTNPRINPDPRRTLLLPLFPVNYFDLGHFLDAFGHSFVSGCEVQS